MRTLVLSLALASSLAAQDAVAVAWNGLAYSVDTTTGTTTLLGNTGFSSSNSMAKDASGTIWCMGGSTLYTLDTTTGVGTSVTSSQITDCRALAFGPGDVLYAIENGSPDTLYTLETTSGTKTLVGGTGKSGIQGMTWSGTTLYAWECGSGSGIGDGLVTLDPTTGQSTDVDPAVTGRCDQGQTLASDALGNLFAGNRTLYSVDPLTGTLTSLMALPDDIRGFEFLGPSLTLSGAPDQISLSSGGSQILSTVLGATAAGKAYQLLGSFSGSVPGITFTGTNVPLNPDPYLIFTLLNPNTPLLNGSAGTLNSLGQATTVLTLPPASDPALAGLTVEHATIVLEVVGPNLLVTQATNAYALLLVP